MEDFKVWFYIIGLLAYYIIKFYQREKKKKEEAPATPVTKKKQVSAQTAPVKRPAPPVAQAPQKPPVKTALDSLFEEFKVETAKEEAPPVWESYEKEETQSTVPFSYSSEYTSEKMEKKIELNRDEFYKQKAGSSNEYAKTLKDPAELKKAFIISEILKRKF